MAHRIVLIAGDGIGPEVAAATRLVLDAADVGIEWIEMPAGAGAVTFTTTGPFDMLEVPSS